MANKNNPGNPRQAAVPASPATASPATAAPQEKGKLQDVKDSVGSAAEAAREKASEIGDRAREQARDVGEQVKVGAQLASMTSKAVASDAIDTLKDKAEEQKNAGANAVGRLARSAGEAADNVESTSPYVANAIRQTANAVERTASDIGNSDLNDLVKAVGEYGQKRPMVLLAAGVVGGILLGRIFGSTNNRT